MKFKFLSLITAAAVCVTAAAGTVFAVQSKYTSNDERNLLNFLIKKEPYDLSDKDYDLNGDGKENVADLCLMKRQNLNNHNIPGEITEIPSDYFKTADKQGTLVELDYDTWENLHYEEHTQKLSKRAIVYLPYGYTDKKQYNIFYYMHGGWSDETSTFGTPDSPNSFKNAVDNAMENGDIKPMIIVCPTYNNTSDRDSYDYSLAMQLNRTYYHELLNDLMPAVEGKYSTYAKSTSPEDLKAARDHRAFGGFSMGSVATWRTFEHALDYFRYFMPMSCGTTLDDENIFAAAKGHPKNDYFVLRMTGTSDFAYSYEQSRTEKMRSSEYFTESNDEEGGNFNYRVKKGYSHDGKALEEYTYNGWEWFWNNSGNTGNTDNSGNNGNNKTPDKNLKFGTMQKDGFTVDDTLHSETLGDIHFSSYIPTGYDGSEPYALFVTLPGWDGLYFQGVGKNLEEKYPFEAGKYNGKMIILSTQLDDWGETSANMAIELTEYFINHYNIDKSKVYLHGYSGGGETGSLVMGKKPELFAAYLMTSSKWDGDLETLAKARTPVYMAIGENDSYYGSGYLKNAYSELHSIYEKQGLSDDEINKILVLDVKNAKYFTDAGYSDQHAGGMAFATDSNIMKWLFNKINN